MGLFHSISEWNKARQEKHIANMKEKGYCPDCHGKGFNTFAGHEFSLYTASLDCPGCNGSGQFTDWEALS